MIEVQSEPIVLAIKMSGKRKKLYQINPQFMHLDGFLSANRASKPIGNKQIATIICHE
jgi:hypothetical protein